LGHAAGAVSRRPFRLLESSRASSDWISGAPAFDETLANLARQGFFYHDAHDNHSRHE